MIMCPSKEYNPTTFMLEARQPENDEQEKFQNEWTALFNHEK